MFRNSFAFTVAWIWNALPEHVKELPSVSAFKKKMKTFNFAATTLRYYIRNNIKISPSTPKSIIGHQSQVKMQCKK